MKVTDQRVIDALNEALKGEMTSIFQYFIHAEMCDNWGYGKLAIDIRNTSVEEMRHAEKYIERILFFEQLPHVHDVGKVNIGKDVKSLLENDLAIETAGVAKMNEWIELCAEAGDNATRELFTKILLQEEAHVDWLEAQLWMIGEIGIGAYLSQKIQSK